MKKFKRDPEFEKRIKESYNKGKKNGTIDESISYPAYHDDILLKFEESDDHRPFLYWWNDRNIALSLLNEHKRAVEGGETDDTFEEWNNKRLHKEHAKYIRPTFEGDAYDDQSAVDHDRRYPANPSFEFWKKNIAEKSLVFPERFNADLSFVDKPRTPGTSSPLVLSHSPDSSFSQFRDLPLNVFEGQRVFEDRSTGTLNPLQPTRPYFSEFPDPPQVSEDRYTETFNPLQPFPPHLTSKNILHSKKKLHSNQKRGGSIRKHKSRKHKSRKYKRKTRRN